MNENTNEVSNGCGSLFIRAGRRKSDNYIHVELGRRRGMAIIDVSHVDGIFLEDVPQTSRGKIGVCLTHADWQGRVYILDRHADDNGVPFKEEHYFDLAYRLMAHKGISYP